MSHAIQKLFHRCNDRQQEKAIILRKNHTISRQSISNYALKVLYRLRKAGFEAYLVGGGVRDLLLKRIPKDFDVVTSAEPKQIRKIFRNSRLIGRRFRLVHVYYDHEIIEVSTFRATLHHDTARHHQYHRMITTDNTYGTIEEDAWRRDFTINALFYNIADFSIVDYTGGMRDLKKRLIRIIGDPEERFHEDPVRLLRAIRLATKLNFKIDYATEKELINCRSLLQQVPAARLLEELRKLFFEGYAHTAFQALKSYGYLQILFPSLTDLSLKRKAACNRLLEYTMQGMDERVRNQQPLNLGFLFAVVLWQDLQTTLPRHEKSHNPLELAIKEVACRQFCIIPIPNRFQIMMKQIWRLQFHLEQPHKRRKITLINHRYFRAAYDFLELRAKVDYKLATTLSWWHSKA